MPGGRPGGARRLKRQLGEQPGRAGMAGVGLADDGIAGRDGRDEVAARDRVEREREVVRAEHDDRAAQRPEARADVRLGVDRRRATSERSRAARRALPQLAGRPRQLDGAAGAARSETRSRVRPFDQRVRGRLDPRRVVVQEARDRLSALSTQRGRPPPRRREPRSTSASTTRDRLRQRLPVDGSMAVKVPGIALAPSPAIRTG